MQGAQLLRTGGGCRVLQSQPGRLGAFRALQAFEVALLVLVGGLCQEGEFRAVRCCGQSFWTPRGGSFSASTVRVVFFFHHYNQRVRTFVPFRRPNKGFLGTRAEGALAFVHIARPGRRGVGDDVPEGIGAGSDAGECGGLLAALAPGREDHGDGADRRLRCTVEAGSLVKRGGHEGIELPQFSIVAVPLLLRVGVAPRGGDGLARVLVGIMGEGGGGLRSPAQQVHPGGGPGEAG